jgi:cyanate lyase
VRFINHKQLQARSIEDKMKKLSATLALAIILNGMTTRISYAEMDRFGVWDELDAATATLFNDRQIDEDEDRNLEEVLGLGRSGQTEEAIRALNDFLKDSRNKALREVTTETMAELISQRRADVVLAAKRAKDRSACTLEMRICPDGVTVVKREGPQCAFAQCVGRPW